MGSLCRRLGDLAPVFSPYNIGHLLQFIVLLEYLYRLVFVIDGLAKSSEVAILVPPQLVLRAYLTICLALLFCLLYYQFTLPADRRGLFDLAQEHALSFKFLLLQSLLVDVELIVHPLARFGSMARGEQAGSRSAAVLKEVEALLFSMVGIYAAELARG